MSTMSEGFFLSNLQPNTLSETTYALPLERDLLHGSTVGDGARTKRVQEQVAQRLAERSTLVRRNISSTSSGSNNVKYSTISPQYPTSEYGGSASMKYTTYNPSFSSKSYMYSTITRPTMTPRVSQQSSSGYSSRSAVDFGTRPQLSLGAARGLFYKSGDMDGTAGIGRMGGGYQGSQSQRYQISTATRSVNLGACDPETASLRLQSLPHQQVANWVTQTGSQGSLGSDHDVNYSQQEAGYATSNGYTAAYSQPFSATISDFRQPSRTLPAMTRSLSGTMFQNGDSGVVMEEEASVRQTLKGPSQRRIVQNRQNRSSVSANSFQGGSSTGGFVGVNSMFGNQNMLNQRRISRANSVRSVKSVGKGQDVFDMGGSMGNLSGMRNLDLQTAVTYLMSSDKQQQALGAAYIQHECYHNPQAKIQVNQMKAIPLLVQLFNSEAQDVQQYATGAARNLIYENMDNKVALIEAGGISKLMEALKEPDDELQKNITGILWNLSSKDKLKDKLARETLPKLTEHILIPLSGTGEREITELTESEKDIFCNTTGCLRNLSSVNKNTRQLMRDTPGLIDALMGYLQNVDEVCIEEKGVENSVCALRNLSYQLYDEIPPSVTMRLEGQTRNQTSSRGEPIGCFTPQSKKAKDSQSQNLSTFSEVSRVPKGAEWLWHPKVLSVYKGILTRCETNNTTREGAAGALQNITAGDKRWPSVLSHFALEQERILPTILDKLNTEHDDELRSLTGFLRNLSRHSRDKNSLSSKLVPHLVAKLPEDGRPKIPSPDVVINICGTLNNLVSCSEVAARDIAYFDGLPKLMGIRDSHDGSAQKQKQAQAAATVLCNMFQYKKLHKEYKKKGYIKDNFQM